MVEAKKIEIQLNAFASMQEDAVKAFEAGDYDQASKLYFTAVKEAAKLYGSGSSEEIECLRGMADSFYKLDRFIEAKSVYLQLIEREEKRGSQETEEAILARLKLARSYECLQEFEPALVEFKKTLELAEKHFTLGNPTLTTILEAFANMLRRARKEPNLLSQLEEKARVSRKKYADPENANKNLNENILDDLEKEKAERAERLKPVWAPKKKISQSSIFYKTGERAQRVIDFARGHPRVFRTLLLAPLMVAFTTLSVTLAITLLETKGQIPIPPSGPAAPGKEYVSFDNKQSVKFLPNGVAEVVSYGTTSKVNYRYARPGWSEILTVLLLSKPGQAWFVATPAGLSLKSGQILYKPDRLEVGLFDRIEKVGAALQKLASRNQPVTAESLQHSCPESRIKLDDGALNPPQKAEPSSQSSPDERHMFVGQQHKVLIDTPLRRDTITFVAHENKSNDDKNNEDKTAHEDKTNSYYIVFATGDDGNILFDKDKIVCAEVNGSKLLGPISRTANVLDGAPAQIVVGSATPEFIMSLYTNIFIWTVLAAIQFAAIFYIESFGLSGSRDSGVVQAQISAQATMWLVWCGFFLLLLMYAGSIAFTYFGR